MKKRITSAILAVCLAMTLLPVNAWAEEGETLTKGKWGELDWNFDSGRLTISGTGNMGAHGSGDDFWYYKGDITSVVIGEGVTSIGEGAFSGCAGLTSVTIPGSVTSIGSEAFKGCASLTSVTIPGSVLSIGEKAFSECAGLTSVTIPNGVTSIGTEAFSWCDKLTSVTIPGTVTSIGNYAFAQCKSLTGVTMLDGTMDDMKTSIGEGAFLWCESLTSVGIPKSVTSIKKDAFALCGGLKDVYYVGPQAEDWNNIAIDKGNEFLTGTNLIGATIHYNSTLPAFYTVTFDPGEGTMNSPRSVTTETGYKLSELPTPTIDDKCLKFEGWYKPDGSKVVANETEFDKDTTVFAKWTESHKEIPIEPEAATCTTAGKTAGKKCSECGKILEEPQEDLDKPATGHTKKTVPGKDATCTKDGLTEGSKCSVCGEILKAQEIVPATGHTEADIAVPATCTEKGKTDGLYCTTCDTIIKEPKVTPALGHTEADIPAVPATCTEKGKTDGVYCTTCDTIIREPKDTPALGHDWDGGTQTVTKEPTCTEEGAKTVDGATCSRCGEKAVKETVTLPAIGHKYGEWITTKEATATQDGEKKRTCSVCKHEETEPIPAIGSDTKYTITFDANGGTITSGSATMTTTNGKLLALPQATRTGYTFDGWYTAKTGGEKVTVSVTKFEKDATLYAHWTQNSTTPAGKTYTITFNANGGSVSPTSAVTNADGKVTLPTPTRAGYTFTGWYTTATGGTQVTASRVFTADTTIYARWSQSTGTYYQIYAPGVTYGGSLYVNHSSAAPGTLVTVTSSPWSNYTLNQLSAIRTDTGREVSLTARYSSQYTFLMPDSDVQLIGSYTQTYTGAVTPSYPGTNTGSSNPGYTGASAGSRTVNWYYSGGNIYHATDGLVPVGTALTRDMLVSVLYNMDSTSSGSPTIWAAENNILPDIYQSGLWGTDKPISREQAAMILLCYARHKGYATSQTANLTGYTDYSQIRTIARPAMAWSQATGLITATSARTLSPQAILTCSEANAILNRFVSSVASGW